MGPRTARLIGRVGIRQRIVSLGSRFHLFFLILAALYAVCLLVSRFLAVIPGRFFDPTTLSGLLPAAGAAAAALILAVVFMHHPTSPQSARLIDTRMNTKDVFLTASVIERAYGEFKPLVLSSAESRAAGIEPGAVVTFSWLPKTRNVVLAVLVAAAGVLFLPQYDLLGKNDARERDAERRKRLEETRKAVALRKAMLKKGDAETRRATEVDLALTDLKQTFNRMKPVEMQANLQSLNDKQKHVGGMWQKLSERRLRDALTRSPTGQRFGSRSLQKEAEWQQQVARGDTSGLRKEIAEIANLARKLSTLSKGAEAAQIREEIRQKLKDLAEFVEKDLNSRPCSSALARAMDQLGLAGAKGLSKEALEALQESLNLSELELAQLAQSMQDLKNLEEALKALQLAKRLNKLNALDGKQCEGCEGIGDYAKLFEEMMKGKGVGPGMGGEGTGKGNVAPEDDELETDYTSEQSRSSMTAGKILLKWKTRGSAPTGQANIDYQKQVAEVKKGVSEAILREQVPPGYHDAVRKYFDSMGAKDAQPEEK